MAKAKEQELAPGGASSADMTVAENQLPAFMQGKDKVGTDNLRTYKNTSRIAFVQPQSDPDLLERHGGGTILIQPDGVEVGKKGDEIVVIPIGFYPSAEVHSDIDDKASKFVLLQTLDPNDDIWKRAKDERTREEPYGEPDANGNPMYTKKYVECLNFLVLIDSGPAKGEIAMLTFNGGEHFMGRKLCGLLDRRPCSIYGNRIALVSTLRKRDRYSWYGFDINNPMEGGAVVQDEALYNKLESLHEELMAAVAAGTISVNREDTKDGAPAKSGSDAGGFDENDLPPM